MWWLSVNFLPTLTPTRSIPSLLHPSAPPPPIRRRHPIFSQIRRRRALSSPPSPRSGAAELGGGAAAATSQVSSSVSGTGRMDGMVHAPSGAEACVAAHPGVNGNGAARHLHDEWLEEYEAGVFMKLKDLGDGTRELKRVRFSKRRFGEHQAENWWKENHEKVYERYNVRISQQASSAASTHSA